MKKYLVLFFATFVILLNGCNSNSQKSEDVNIKAFNIDYNWGPGGAHDFSKPGLWADANPDTLMKWYENLGCNVVHSFGVSCNGYAWYKNGIVPEQPGLKYDFLTEMVKIGRKKNMKVFGYYCVGANNKWIPCEQEMYQELMSQSFPGKDKITPEIELDFRRKAIDRAWKQIREVAKKTKKDCIIWLTAYDVNSKEYAGSAMLKEVDWLMNEAGDIASTAAMRGLAGNETRLITCLANWNNQNPAEVVPAAIKKKVGLYGFTKPVIGPMMLPVEYYLSHSVDSLKGDEQNIAILARVYNNFPMDYTK